MTRQGNLERVMQQITIIITREGKVLITKISSRTLGDLTKVVKIWEDSKIYSRIFSEEDLIQDKQKIKEEILSLVHSI
jgi:hypothetical protein